jgi:hypothetical protein
MGRYGIGDTTQDHTGFTTNTVRDVALHQSIATAFRHRYHRPHFFSLSLSLSRSSSRDKVRRSEAASPQEISLFSYREEKIEAKIFRVVNPNSSKRSSSFPLSFGLAKVSFLFGRDILHDPRPSIVE